MMVPGEGGQWDVFQILILPNPMQVHRQFRWLLVLFLLASQ